MPFSSVSMYTAYDNRTLNSYIVMNAVLSATFCCYYLWLWQVCLLAFCHTSSQQCAVSLENKLTSWSSRMNARCTMVCYTSTYSSIYNLFRHPGTVAWHCIQYRPTLQSTVVDSYQLVSKVAPPGESLQSRFCFWQLLWEFERNQSGQVAE